MNNIDVFFKYVSKYIFFVPLLIIIVGLLSYVSKTKSTVFPSALLSPTPKPQSKISNSISDSIGIDLMTSKTCMSVSKEASLSASIKNNAVLGTIRGKELQNILLKDDCVYHWIEGGAVGKKICGISRYMGIMNVIKGSSGGSSNLLSMLPMVQQYLPMGSAKDIPVDVFQNLLKSCKKATVPDSLLEVPKSVKFSQ